MNQLNEMIEKFTDFLKSEVRTENIIGQQFTLGEFSCVPVMSVGFGLGAGGGEGKDGKKDNAEEGTGAGGGAGIGMSPLGFLVTRGGDIQFISTHTSKGLAATFEKIPDLVGKFMDKKKETTN